MTAQLDLFGPPKVIRRRPSEEMRALGRIIEQAASGGLVNGMTKAQLRRHAPERLAPITVPRGGEDE